jgi:2-oxoglutarate ferredoxin oxidoreductase subunit delta
LAQFTVTIDGDVCKGCELCVSFCPKGIIGSAERINGKGYTPAGVTRQDECVGCCSCALVCPDGAISIYARED